MQHIILTRVNINLFCGIQTEAAMHYRLDVFEQTAYRSISAQQNTDFEMWLLTDPDVPDSIKRREESYTGVRVVYLANPTGQFSAYWKDVADLIREEYTSGTVITTSLDSDDLIPRDYVSRINEYAQNTTDLPVLLTPSRRIVYYTREGLSACTLPMTPPLHALVENGDTLRTCCSRPHGMIALEGREVVLPELTSVMVAHKMNVYTTGGSDKVSIDKTEFMLRYGIRAGELDAFLAREDTDEVNVIGDQQRKAYLDYQQRERGKRWL